MKKKKYLIPIISLLFISISVGGIWYNNKTSNKPDVVLSNYLEIIQEKTYDHNKAFNYVYTEPLSKEYLAAIKERSNEPDRPTFKNYKISSTNKCEDKNKCELVVTYTWFEDAKTDVNFKLIKIDGKWKIDLTEFEKEYLANVIEKN